MVQRRAARFVMADYDQKNSVTQMLNNLQWQSLHERRAKSKVIIMYRIVHGLVAIPAAPPYVSCTYTHLHQIRLEATIYNSHNSIVQYSHTSIVSCQVSFVSGMPYQPSWFQLSLWRSSGVA